MLVLIYLNHLSLYEMETSCEKKRPGGAKQRMPKKRAGIVFQIIQYMHRGLQINIHVTQIYSSAEGSS